MWPHTPSELVRVQHELAAARPAPWSYPGRRPLVAGVFVCFARGAAGHAREAAWVAATLMKADRRPVATVVLRGEASSDYAPGLLALREGHLLERAVRALPARPDVVIANASGRDHPRGAGLALHLGAVLGVPSVGITDRPLVAGGSLPAPVRWATSPLAIDGVEVARWLRTRAGARPVVVHPGWRASLDAAVSVVRASTRRARTPEPLRRARQAARTARAAETASPPGPAAS